MYGISEKTFQLMLQSFQTIKEIDRVVLFGSRAMGNDKPGSDIDIAIEGQDITPGIVSSLYSLLNEEIPSPYHFDVVDFRNTGSEELKKHIDKFGKEIFFRKEKNG